MSIIRQDDYESNLALPCLAVPCLALPCPAEPSLAVPCQASPCQTLSMKQRKKIKK